MEGSREEARPASRGIRLDEAAALTGADLQGPGDLRVTGVSTLDDASAEELALLSDRRYLERAAGSAAGAFLVAGALAPLLESDPRPRLVCADPHVALRPLLARLHPVAPSSPGVHPSAVLGRGVVLGEAVTVGPWAVIEDDAEVGDRTVVHAHVVVGTGVRVGPDCVLHPHVALYPGAVLGARVVVHAGAAVASDGFGYAFEDGEPRKVPQVGRCVVEDDVEIGANATLDRGSIGDTVVGKGTKIDNLVHVAHNCRIGRACVLTAQVGLAGSTVVGDGVLFGGQAGVAGHLTIGPGARIAAQAGIIGDIAAGATVAGFPARDHGAVMKGAALTLRLPELVRRVRELERRLDEADDGKDPA